MPQEDANVWVHSIHISVTTEADQSPPAGSIDMGRVRELIDEMGSNIPKGAADLMGNVEHFQKVTSFFT